MRTHYLSTEGNVNYVCSFQCALAKSQLADVLWVSLDHAGSVTAITQSVNNGNTDNCRDLTARDFEALDEFNTDVYVKPMESAPIPDTASFIQKLEREREARERGETKDNRGFFAKYVSFDEVITYQRKPDLMFLFSGCTSFRLRFWFSFPEPLTRKPQVDSVKTKNTYFIMYYLLVAVIFPSNKT